MNRRSQPWDAGVTDGDTQLAYLRARRGPETIVLLHGWPESSWAWRGLIPRLDGYDVIAFDLPGIGGSSPSRAGYDKRGLALTLFLALGELGLGDGVGIVGHDIGAMVGYAFARMFPAFTRSLLILDQPLPGVDGWDELSQAYASWHLGFHRDTDGGNGLAEQVLAGNEARYLRRHIDRFAVHGEAITDYDVEIYTRAYAPAARLQAGFEMFRTLPVDVEANAGDSGLIAVRTLLAFGEYSQATLLPVVDRGLRRLGLTNVESTTVRDCGHWIAEEQPARLAELIREVNPSR